MKRIRVLIVDDSPVAGEHLKRIIAADCRFEVLGIVTSGEEAVRVTPVLSPDVITMDIHLPGMQGFEATRRIMATCPTPIVIVSGTAMTEVELTMQAFKAGALSVVEKPVAATHQAYHAIAGRLCTQLAIMSEVKVVRQRDPSQPRHSLRGKLNGTGRGWRLLTVGASTGGPNALFELLTGLGPSFPLPVAIVQHMAPAFIDGFARWLSSVTNVPVSVVTEPVPLVPGTVYLPAGEAHLVVDDDSAALDSGPPAHGHRPSASVLFSSAARYFGASAIGVLLTGMGEDGAAGLYELKAAGGFTIAEAESTAVVYGMPGTAVRLGAVCESVAIHDLAGRILDLVARKEVRR